MTEAEIDPRFDVVLGYAPIGGHAFCSDNSFGGYPTQGGAHLRCATVDLPWATVSGPLQGDESASVNIFPLFSLLRPLR